MNLSALWNFMLLFSYASCELYSSINGMERFLQTEKYIIQIFQSFILETEQRIAELKTQIERLEQEHKKTTGYTRDPYNNFRLVNRIITEWSIMEKLLPDTLLQETKKSIIELKSSKDFPTDQDLKISAEAINIISNIYNIDITSIANGNVNGFQYPSQLSAYDCYEMGMQSYLKNQFDSAYSWMDEALKIFHEEGNVNAFEEENALEVKAYSAYKLGDYQSALNITNELLKNYPDNKNAPNNIEFYNYLIHSQSTEERKQKENETSKPEWEKAYKEICSNAVVPPKKITSQLKCRYINNDVPFLRLAPIKEEEVFLNPRIVLFKDALYDSEIEILKELAIPKLKSASVVNFEKGGELLTSDRIAQMSWLSEDDHPKLKTILLRAEDMTKLDPSKGELLQVVNYGIGGHYKPHWDYLEGYGMQHVDMENGDRIATLLYYMNDVDQGGATAFTNLNLGVRPEKGTAILWFNILPDGEKDNTTMHASCPVLAGTKWIATKWFNERGQEFRRPCELKNNI